MDYQVYISTPKNTPESDPVKTVLRLTEGKVFGGWIYFPYGPAGVLHIRLFRGGGQIAPANQGASYNLDDAVVPLSLDIELDEPPYLLTAKTWNTSATYDHALSLALFLKEARKNDLKKPEREVDRRAEELIHLVRAGK